MAARRQDCTELHTLLETNLFIFALFLQPWPPSQKPEDVVPVSELLQAMHGLPEV
jgi:hypothetical protein